jgi:chaperonin GroEL (HSP60 family)
VAVLLCEQKLSSLQELLPLLEQVVKAGRPLLVIAEEIDSDALAALVINTMRGTLKTCAVKAPAYGYNAATREFGDLLQMGVIDPAKVTRLALQNAGSIAGLILTTDCLIASAPASQAAALPGAPAPEF